MPVYDRARAAMLYDGTARRLVHQLKYSDRMDLAGLMARWMVIAGRELLDGADLLVPVPLHRRRLIWRRFNQAAALANAISRQTAVPADVMLLERSKPTRSQVGLSRAGRRRNVRGAFKLSPKFSSGAAGQHAVAGKHIVLIDDVLTSGATVEACAAVLRRAGAAQVDVLTLARVVAPQDATI
jgi:ComF family protein